MTKLPDSADWYTPARAMQEEITWIINKPHAPDLAFLLPHLRDAGIKTVIEFGCGTGLLAAGLLDAGVDVQYLGIDKNSSFCARARLRNAGPTPMRFLCWDARSIDEVEVDLVIAVNFLKHFELAEWDQMVKQVLRHGRHGLLSMQFLSRDVEDGVEFTHVFVTEERLRKAVAAAGHEIVDRGVQQVWEYAPGEQGRQVIFWTRRKE